MQPANPRILTINGSSSRIRFALFEAGDALRRSLEGVQIERSRCFARKSRNATFPALAERRRLEQ
jgi:hypothetical protein